ncbi:Uncharacterised protein [Amycolatopsis camponoti]|uniref:Secreted protein n=1 Tax=Amycolatopsis camponoti TaxID=2606593 RepID=A0A6I8LZH9_9PSEU|nr:hypothetical protein [Amycolatopsis camponoti]VVJ22901.1 Uncharacterised protein [Amycolatopsis camponoti]
MFRRALLTATAICAALFSVAALPAQAATSPTGGTGGTALQVPAGESMFAFDMGPAPASTPRSGESVSSSPKCSSTGTYGVLRYQVCFRYNCDSKSCNTWAYLGIVNNATTPRSVDWHLTYSTSYNPGVYTWDDSGTNSIAATDQQTIFSGRSWHHYYCNFRHNEQLIVQYGSADWSPEVVASDYLACV